MTKIPYLCGRSCASGGHTRAIPRTTAVALPDGQPYDVGSPRRLRTLYVDPQHGNDANTGATQAHAFKSFNAAWDLVRARRGGRVGWGGEGRWAGPSCAEHA